MPREMVRGQLVKAGGSIRDNLELPFLALSRPSASRVCLLCAQAV